MAEIATPLYTLTRKGVHWNWTRDCEESYRTLCTTLSNNSITLAYPNWKRTLYVEVDASGSAVGGVLAQKDQEGRLRPICFFSCLLEERRISRTDWPKLTQEITFVCNSLVNVCTGFTPHEIMFMVRFREKWQRILRTHRKG